MRKKGLPLVAAGVTSFTAWHYREELATAAEKTPHSIKITVSSAFFMIGLSLAWRRASTRTSMPLPAALSQLVEIDNPLAPLHHAQHIIRTAGIRPGMTILDAGSGPGRTAIPAAIAVTKAGSVTALDIQQEMLEKVRSKAEAAGLSNVSLHRASLGNGTLPLEKFDIALLVTVLGEIPLETRVQAMLELHRALKPGGYLSIIEIVFDPHFQSASETEALAKCTGFEKHELVGHRFLGMLYAYHMRLQRKEFDNPSPDTMQNYKPQA